MRVKETFIEALEKWAVQQPDKVVWTFYSDKLVMEDTYTYLVSKSCVLPDT